MDAWTLAHTAHLWLFAVMVFGIVVLPGLDMAYVMASALVDGRRSGLLAVAGIVVGGAVHVAMGALGLAVLLGVFPAAFNALLLAGALYIAWIGWSLWRGATALGDVAEVADMRPRAGAATFVRAVATCLLNPKAYVFMLAVFPQFLRPEYGAMAPQALALWLIIAVNQVVIYGAMALGAAGARGWLRTHPAQQVLLGRAVGLVLMGAALWTAWEGWRVA